MEIGNTKNKKKLNGRIKGVRDPNSPSMIYTPEEFLLLVQIRMEKSPRKKRASRTGEKSSRLNPLVPTFKPTISFDSSPPQNLAKTGRESQAIFAEEDNLPAETITQSVIIVVTPKEEMATQTAEDQGARNPPASNPTDGETLVDAKQGTSPALPKSGGITIFVGSTKTTGHIQESLPEDPQDEEGDEEYVPPTAEEIRKYNLKRQAQFQVALSLLTAFKNGALQTLEKDKEKYIQSFISPEISGPDTTSFIVDSINVGMEYWNRNAWDVYLNEPTQAKELQTICFDLKDRKRRPNLTPEITRQEILKHFS